MANELSRFKASFRRAPRVTRHGSTARMVITQLDHRVMRAYVAYRIDVPSMMLTATATVMDRPDGSGPVLHWIRVMEQAEQGGGFGLELLEWIVKVEGPLDALWCTESGIALATAYERRWGDQAWTKELL